MATNLYDTHHSNTFHLLCHFVDSLHSLLLQPVLFFLLCEYISAKHTKYCVLDGPTTGQPSYPTIGWRNANNRLLAIRILCFHMFINLRPSWTTSNSTHTHTYLSYTHKYTHKNTHARKHAKTNKSIKQYKPCLTLCTATTTTHTHTFSPQGEGCFHAALHVT